MDTRSVAVAPERLPKWLAGFAERHGLPAYEITPGLVTVTGEDGAVARITVPFPPLHGDLVEHVQRPRRYGVLLVRRGGYGAGVFEGGTVVESKVGSRHVQGGTKAGGWSQQRFARRRENQAREAFAAAADVAARILAPADLEALFCGGDRLAIDTVLADRRLAGLRDLVREPFLGVPDPKQRVLVQAAADARAIRIDVLEVKQA
jgi:hypothetical protein